MGRPLLFGFLLCLLSVPLAAQITFYDFGFERDGQVRVEEDSRVLRLPWAGGLNSVHFSEIDLDTDGSPDLLGFEKHGNRLLPFLRRDGGFEYAPQYVRFFPDLHDWAIFYDYNHDGKPDIFTYGLASIRVFENISTDTPRFRPVTDALQAYYYNGYTNIYASPDDYLVVDDVDEDGHLDILNFWVLGRYVHQLRNYANEGDPLDFHLENECWGHFSEAADNNVVTLFTDCADKSGDGPTRHTGSSMLLHDFDGNGLPDLLLGDVDSPYNILLYNHGTLSDARMTRQDTAFPAFTPIKLYSMPAASFVSLPGHGAPSLVVSPSDPSLTKSQDLNSVWVYDYNAQIQQYVLVQTDFLQGEMVDVGSGAYPVFYDFDGDGLQDLFIGNYGRFDSAATVNGWLIPHFSSSVRHYRNTGSAAMPAFTLQTDDFGNLRMLGERALYPAFGDFDSDGLTDMLCGREDGTLLLVPNARLTTGMGSVTENFAGIDVGEFSTPQHFDLDGDGNADLVIGNRRGLLSYYRGGGSETGGFQKITDTLGGVDMRDFTQSYFGYSVPCLYRDAQRGTVLFCGGEQGEIAYYKQIDGNLSGVFEKAEPNLAETVEGTAYAFREGRRVAPAVSDLDGDGRPELLIGNYAGGAAFFRGANPPAHTSVGAYEKPVSLRVYPNPSRGVLHVESDRPMQRISLYDIYGRMVMASGAAQTAAVLDVSGLPAGVYLLKANGAVVTKVVITK